MKHFTRVPRRLAAGAAGRPARGRLTTPASSRPPIYSDVLRDASEKDPFLAIRNGRIKRSLQAIWERGPVG